MSDTRPRRAPREHGRDDAAAHDAIAGEPAATAPIAEPVPISPLPAAKPPAGEPSIPATEDAWTALVDAQTALVDGFAQITLAVAGIGRSGLVATGDAAVALLGARSLVEAAEVNVGLARRSVDVLTEGSARLSEIGVKAAAKALRPLLTQFA